MIRIERIEIEEFRGIRKLALDLKKKNFGICGPNGTGKSGIVDAIEFALTGSITRLAGRGTSDLSVKDHAPHVDSRKATQKSKVKVTAFMPALNQAVIIERKVSAPGEPVVTPLDAKIGAIVAELAMHPEFALSRREIIKYILTPAGQRSKDVQELLRLAQIEKIRQSLQKISNVYKTKVRDTQNNNDRAQREFLEALGISKLSKTELLGAINQRRTVLGLPEIADLTTTTAFKEGLASSKEKKEPTPKIKKPIAMADLKGLQDDLDIAEPTDLQKCRKDAETILKTLEESPEILRSFKRQVLTQQGLDLTDEDMCPLCDKPWNMAELRAHLEQKLTSAEAAAKILKNLQSAIQPITKRLQELEGRLDNVLAHCRLLDTKIDRAPLEKAKSTWKGNRECMDGFFVDPWPAAGSVDTWFRCLMMEPEVGHEETDVQ